MIINNDINIFGGESKENIIDLVNGNPNSIAYGLDSIMRSYLNHYTIVKTRYKKLAFTWLIATFIGLSYFLRGAEKNIHLNQYIVITFLTFLPSFGISLLYFLDVGIYQKIREAIFKASLVFENEHSFLGSTSQNIVDLLIKGKSHPIIYEGLLYVAIISVLLFIGSLSVFYFINTFSFAWAITVFCFLLVFIFLYNAFLIFCSLFTALTFLFPNHKK